MQADDFMAAIFPRLAACQENVTGPVEIPDHPVVRQTLDDCLHEAMDVDGLAELLRGVESGAVRIHTRETTEPSLLAHEILNGRPYTFLDDAPLEERRTRAITLRRGLPEAARDLGELDSEAIARVRDEARPQPRDVEETHDALLGFGVCRPVDEWRAHFDILVCAARAATVWTRSGPMWFARESRALVDALYPDAAVEPDLAPLAALAAEPRPDREHAVCEVVRGHLDATGPRTLADLAREIGVRDADAEQALARLEAEGFLLRGSFSPGCTGAGGEEYCARRLLARIHRYTHARLRREIEPVTAQDFMRFLLRWQHVTPETRREGRRGTLAVVEQLQGFELAAGAWEEAVLTARIESYRPEWLDDLCLAGEVVWGRPTPRLSDDDTPVSGRGGAVPSRATPITLALRGDLPWWLAASRGTRRPALPGPGAALDVIECLQSRGALFQTELVDATGRLPLEVEQALWDLVSRGLVAADGYQSLRSLLGPRPGRARRRIQRRRGLRRGVRGRGVAAEGRWALLPPAEPGSDREELVEAVAEQLLARWGVVFRDLIVRENLEVSWRELLYALRRFEDRGAIRGGRFVTGFTGEQFALPGAVEALRQTRRSERTQQIVRLCASDPLNLVGILSPGPRVPAVRSREVVYCDGQPLETDGASESAPAVGHHFRSA
jgi:ATP-dependent Lhr-like helicase